MDAEPVSCLLVTANVGSVFEDVSIILLIVYENNYNEEEFALLFGISILFCVKCVHIKKNY